jgi:hypothetical protein
MLHTTHTPSRLVPALVAGLLALAVLSGCGSDDNPAAGSGDQSSSSGSKADTSDATADGDQADDPAEADSGTDGGTDADDPAGSEGDGGSGGDEGSGSDGAADDANSPFVVAAAAVGTRSRDQVVTLHAMGFSTTHDKGLPHQALPAQGEQIQEALDEQVQAATQLTPPKGSPAARLVASLSSYGDLAGDLASWNPDGAPLPPSWFTKIAAADKTWTKAMEDLSDLSDDDLLANMPELLMPASM